MGILLWQQPVLQKKWLKELGPEPVDNQEDDNERKNVSQVWTKPFWHFKTISFIDLRIVIVAAPAVAAHTKERIDKASERKSQIADKEVFQIEDVAARAKWGEAG